MSSAKALIFASRWYEGQPMTIIEAYKSSLPIISCDIGNANDLIIEGSTGMHFKNDESNSLIDIVDKFNFVDIRQFEAGSRKEYENKYIDSIGYKKIDVMYSQILNH
jgi:glycosyltransferase involved in cell wall biosynthesis